MTANPPTIAKATRKREEAEAIANRPLTLNELAVDVEEWHARELPGKSLLIRVAKVAEEAGELVGALIKFTETLDGHRLGDVLNRYDDALEELGDVIIAAIGAANALLLVDVTAGPTPTVEQLVARRWAVVRERRFATAERTT